MSKTNEYTLSKYLGLEFQMKLMWQLLVDPEFAEKTISSLAVEYFDDNNYKRLFIIMKEYYDEFEKVTNLQNESIHHAIKKYTTSKNNIEEEILFSIIDKIKTWDEMVINKKKLHDGDAVQKDTLQFIKQQEYRKLGEYILTKTKSGEIKKKYILGEIEQKIHNISDIGDEEDYGIEVGDDVDDALRETFRESIPTGIKVLDEVTGGGLGKGEIGVILTASGVGKALPNSHKVLTPNGWVKNGDLKNGDLVFGSNGKPQKVLGVYPQGLRDIYKMEFSDQTKSYCDLDHLWAVNSKKQRTQKTNINGESFSIPDHTFQTLKTSELMEDVKIKGCLNYRLPNISPIVFNEKTVRIDPYVMGVLLGDGCLTRKNQPHIITSDSFIVEKIKLVEKSISIHEYEGRKDNYKKLYRISLLNLRKVLEDLNLYGTNSSTKFIPNDYFYNSVKNRISILQGLIDSDGTIGKNNAIIYTTVSKTLSENLRELVLSLGGTCRIIEKTKSYKNKDNVKVSGKLTYSLTISFPNNGVVPCTLPKKVERFVSRDKYEFNKFIKNIEYSHQEEATCIYVENDDHLYVIDDYILTHNTTLLTKIANTGYESGEHVAQIVFEDTKQQIQRKHYTIWSKIGLTELSTTEDNRNYVSDVVKKKINKIETEKRGKLIIKRFSQENTTMLDIRNWMRRYEKKYGIKFGLLVLDYLDCLESHKRTPDRNESELAIIKSFEALAADNDIPAWTAIQSNRTGFDAEIVEANQTGGSIKRIQKAHLFMSVAKTADQKESHLANIKIIKARFAQDGQIFKDCIFNNDTMEIKITDNYLKRSKLDSNVNIDNLNKKIDKVNTNTMIEVHSKISEKSAEIEKNNISVSPNEEFNNEKANVDNENKDDVDEKLTKKSEEAMENNEDFNPEDVLNEINSAENVRPETKNVFDELLKNSNIK